MSENFAVDDEKGREIVDDMRELLQKLPFEMLSRYAKVRVEHEGEDATMLRLVEFKHNLYTECIQSRINEPNSVSK